MADDTFDVLAGDFLTGTVSFTEWELHISTGSGFGEMLYAKEVACLEEVAPRSWTEIRFS